MNNFSILIINTRGTTNDLNVISELLEKTLLKVLPISTIDYTTFKTNTSSKAVPFYIMERKNEELYAKIEDVEALKNTFKPKFNLGTYSAPLSNDFNPRYGVFDVHKILLDDNRERFAFRLLLNKIIPISMYSILSKIAFFISNQMSVEVLSVNQEENCQIEVVEKWTASNIEKKLISPVGKGIIGKYMKDENISINSVLFQMDENVEISMAPNDMIELEDMYQLYLASKSFMESNNLIDSKEYSDALTLVKSAEIDLLRTKSLLNKEVKVVSKYFKIFDPNKLQDFKVKPVNIQQNKTEIWGA